MRHRGARLAIISTIALAFAWPVFATRVEGVGGRKASRPPAVDYTRFSHQTAAHEKACASCHTFPSRNWKEARAGGEPFEDVTEFPDHASCIGCHREQFFARERPAPRICSVCHVAVTPRLTGRRAFPSPPERFRADPRAREFVSAFRIAFPHAKHEGLFGDAPASCATCHATYQSASAAKGAYETAPPKDLGDGFWLAKGTFKTTPDSHAACFSCHSAESGLAPAPTDCATCHVPAGPAGAADFDPKKAEAMGITDPAILDAWRRRHGSATFPHEGGVHAELECASCHEVAAMNTADDRATRVSVLSCSGEMGCHVTATIDEGGALTYELERRKADSRFSCSKCHLAHGGAAVPPSHTAVVEKVRGK